MVVHWAKEVALNGLHLLDLLREWQNWQSQSRQESTKAVSGFDEISSIWHKLAAKNVAKSYTLKSMFS